MKIHRSAWVTAEEQWRDFFFLKILGEVALELKTDDIGKWIKWHLLLLKWVYADGNVCSSLEEISIH